MFVFFKEKNDVTLKNNIFINNKFIDNYFSNIEKSRIINPLIMSDLYKKYYFYILIFVNGGGLINKTKAIELAINRAFYRNAFINGGNYFNSLPVTSKTLDLRKKERKKFGLKKARKASQYSKR